MATVKFFTGTENQLKSKQIEDGAIYVVTDTSKLAVDINNKRITMGELNFSTQEDVQNLIKTFN